MKLAIAIADAKAGPSAFVVWRGFDESIKKAAEYGYDGVELALRSKEDVALPSLRALLSAHRMEVSAISTGQTFADLNLYLTAQDPEKRGRAVSVLSGLVELAGEFGCMVNLGRVRGFVEAGQQASDAARLFEDALYALSEKAGACGAAVIVEPVNRYEINFINSVDDALAILEKPRFSHVGVMPDVFHMNIEDASIGGALRKAGGLVKYIHLADSNRHAPGWGHLNFEEVLSALRDIGFDGWASVEILPIPTPDEAAMQAARFLKPLITAYNARQRRAQEGKRTE